MQVRHTGPEPVYLPAAGDWVQPGESVDVPDEDAGSLIEQGWKTGAGKQPKGSDAPKRPRPKKADLIALAEERGVEVAKSWTVADIEAAIEESAAPAAPEPATAEQED